MLGPASHTYFSQRLRLHYVDWGNPGAPPMLLVHGGRDHCRNWAWVAQAFAEDYHVIAPDLRGHGDSQWMIGGSYSISEFVYDTAQLIHQAGLAPLRIIGHSLGGASATLAQATHELELLLEARIDPVQIVLPAEKNDVHPLVSDAPARH